MTRRFAVLLALLFPAVVFAQQTCPFTVGGPVRVDVTGGMIPWQPDGNGNYPAAVTVIDVSHPAIVRIDATRLTFQYIFLSSEPAEIVVAAVRAAGDEYRVVDKAAPFEITPQQPSPSPLQAELRTITLTQPLHFEPGDMLAIEAKPAPGFPPGLITNSSTSPQGVLALPMELGHPTFHPFPFVNPLASTSIAAAVQGGGSCEDIPPAEVLLPVVGDIDGVVHYSTEVGVSIGPTYPGESQISWTIYDRLRNPNATTIIRGTSSTTPQNSIATISNLPSAYLGSMIIQTGPPHRYPIPDGAQATDFVTATAKIKAAGPSAVSSESIEAVSCNRLAHTVVIPFHLERGQRLNVGAASADLRSCGIVVQATSVRVRFGGQLETTIAMPAGSMQLNDVTGANTPLSGAAGMTDGFIYVTVTDEASRIVAYSSIVEGASQTIAYGMTLR